MSVASEFDALRPRLVGVAYGLLGSVTEAEDVVQEAWIRLQRSNLDEIDDLTGWLVTTTSRLALDVLRSARSRRESYVGPWLPEPVETAADPARRGSAWPTPSRGRCWSSWRRWPRPSARRSSCTTCSGSRSPRSVRRWAETPQPVGNWPRALATTSIPASHDSRSIPRCTAVSSTRLRRGRDVRRSGRAAARPRSECRPHRRWWRHRPGRTRTGRRRRGDRRLPVRHRGAGTAQDHARHRRQPQPGTPGLRRRRFGRRRRARHHRGRWSPRSTSSVTAEAQRYRHPGPMTDEPPPTCQLSTDSSASTPDFCRSGTSRQMRISTSDTTARTTIGG